jgi:hypothetical protein
MDGLIRFLLARLSDDERELRARAKAGGTAFPTVERAVADCAAKREIIGIVQRMMILRDLPMERPVRDGASEVLKRMAAVYHDHTEYRPDWRPASGGVLT